MKNLVVLFIATIFVCPALADGVIERYDVDLEIFPERGEIKATTVITLIPPEEGFQELIFTFNKNLTIKSVTSDVEVAYEVKSDEKPPFSFADKAAPLVIRFAEAVKPGVALKLKLEYEGPIGECMRGTNAVTKEWVELGAYSAWFPIIKDFDYFNYRIKVKVDPAYKVMGIGEISHSEDVWDIKMDSPMYTMVVMASPKLGSKCVEYEGYEICLHYPPLYEESAGTILSDLKDIFSNYINWFGPVAVDQLDIVIPNRSKGSGYARGPFIVTPYRGDSVNLPGFNKNSGHEMSHLWWNKALSSTWELWLNEAFAEYSTLLMTREWYGEEAYSDYVKRYREQTKDKPPIWGLELPSNDVFPCLYLKGAVLLHDLKEKIGEDKFFEFLKSLAREEELSTEKFLTLLEEHTSKETRDFFEQGLKK